MISIPRQVMVLLYKGYSFSTTASGWFGDESLIGKMSHVLFKILDLIWKKERVWHEAVINWEEPLKSTYDYTENVFLCKMLR